MAMSLVPVALLDSGFVRSRLVDPVLGKQWLLPTAAKDPKMWTLNWGDSVTRFWGHRLADTTNTKNRIASGAPSIAAYYSQFEVMSLVILVVNKRPGDVTLSLSEGSALYGNMQTGPVVLGWDDDHGHTVETTSNLIPAAVPAENLWGTGLIGLYSSTAFRGCGLVFGFSMGDLPNETSVWFAAQNAYSSSNGLYCSLALTNDHSLYDDMADFYDKACDNNRTADASVKLLAGHGKDPSAHYEIAAHAAPMYAKPPQWAQSGGSTPWQYQVILEIS